MESKQERQEPKTLKKGDLVGRGIKAWDNRLDRKYGFGIVMDIRDAIGERKIVKVYWQKLGEPTEEERSIWGDPTKVFVID